jgi:hypothetical protein
MHKVEHDLFVMDLGVIERADGNSSAPSTPSTEPVTVTAMRLCRQVEEAVAQGRFASYAAAGRSLGLAKEVTNKYRLLARLSEPQQRDILEGKVAGCTIADLLKVTAIESPAERDDAFAVLVAASSAQPPRMRSTSADESRPSTSSPDAPALRVRVAVYFNPDRFVHERLQARKVLERIDVFAAELNASLAAPRSRHTPQSIAPAIDRRLRQDALLEAIEIRITEQAVAGRTRYHVALSLDEAEWARRRRYDGFTVLVAHPDLTQNATDLCRLYRAKDAVEKDFHVIKSVVELRPVRHRNDGKVRAHVTLCMLALLLERTLQCRLASHSTAEAALELLESCHLNRYAGKDGATAAYTVTAPDAEQLKLLRTLRLQHLVDDESLADRMTPR